MRTIQYFYIPDKSKDNVTGEEVTVLRPKIPIRLVVNGKFFPNLIDGLFDTGSDRNLFPSDFITWFGIKLEKGDYKKIGGIGNMSPIDAYTHKVTIYVGVKQIKTEIDFSKDHFFQF